MALNIVVTVMSLLPRNAMLVRAGYAVIMCPSVVCLSVRHKSEFYQYS